MMTTVDAKPPAFQLFRVLRADAAASSVAAGQAHMKVTSRQGDRHGYVPTTSCRHTFFALRQVNSGQSSAEMDTTSEAPGVFRRVEGRPAPCVEALDPRVAKVLICSFPNSPAVQVRNTRHQTMTVPSPSQSPELLGDHPADRVACSLLDSKEPILHSCECRIRGG